MLSAAGDCVPVEDELSVSPGVAAATPITGPPVINPAAMSAEAR